MRVWQLAAIAAATMTAHGVPAAAEAPALSGLSSDEGLGGVLGVTAQSGKPLSRNFRLRVEYSLPVLPGNTQLLRGKARPRRVATMLDFYPEADSGLHLSAGIRFLSKLGRQVWNPYRASQANALIYSPALVGRLPDRTNIARNAPAMTMGWTRTVSNVATFGIEAGTIFEHGGASRTSGSIADARLGTARWSRIDPVAQVAFALKF